MTEKQVPEETELAVLKKLLEGRHWFGRQRGKFGDKFTEYLLSLVRRAPSGEAVGDAARQLCADLKIILHTMRGLDNGSDKRALGEFCRTLAEPGSVLPGETIPIEQTVPWCVAMLEPEKTLALLEWLKTQAALIPIDGAGTLIFEAEDRAMFAKHFPELLKSADLFSPDFFIFSLGVVYRDTVLTPHDESATAAAELALHRGHNVIGGYRLSESSWSEEVWQNSGRPLLNLHTNVDGWLQSLFGSGFRMGAGIFPLFVLPLTSPKEAHELFSREEQGRVAIWTFDLPKTLPAKTILRKSSIGIFPESEHPHRRERDSVFTSVNVQAGLGLTILIRDYSNFPPRDEGHLLLEPFR